MNRLTLSLLAASAGLAMTTAAHAEDAARPLGLVFNVGAATDYVFRGVSQTMGNGEAFGGADISYKWFYAGAWLSNVDFGDSTSMEYDIYAGAHPVLGPVTFDFGAIRYGYTKIPDAAEWTYWEAKAAGSMALGPATVGAAFFYSPNTTGPLKVKSYYYELNGAMPIPSTKLSVSGAVGYQDFDDPFVAYAAWNAGVGYALTDKVGFDLRYWDTSKHELGKGYKARVVGSVKVTF